MSPTKVFISYCYDEVHSDENRIRYFISELKRLLNKKKFDIIIDFQKIKTGRSVTSFMYEMAQECDVAILLLTPEYKKRVENRKRGVNTEFNILYQRYLKYKDEGTYGTEFLLLPIAFIGSFEDVKIEPISHLLSANFNGLYVGEEKNGVFDVPNIIKKKYDDKFTKICEEAKYIRTCKTREYKRKRAKVFKFLFKDAKSSWNEKESQKYIDNVFVKTSVYLNVRDENVRFIIGRKGSGKSTITHVLPVLDERYFDFSIPVVVEHFYLETCYNLFSSSIDFESDSQHVFSRIDSLKYIWDVFLHLCFAYKFVIEYPEYWRDPHITPLKNLIFDILRWEEKIWNKNTTPNSKNYNSLFLHSFSLLPDFNEDCFEKMRENRYAADLVNLFHIDRYREYTLQRENVVGIWNALNYCKKRILLSFDGFDTAFELFRRESIKSKVEDLEKRAVFEQNWLLAFVLLIHDNGFAETHKNELYKKFHYCITVPFDRYLEMKAIDRDSYRNRNDFIPLRWSGIELSALIRKRLIEYITEFEDEIEVEEDKELPLHERLENVIDSYYPEIPKTIDVEYNGIKSTMPLFIYIIRHSFWRPRDILYYYGDIIAASKSRNLVKRGKQLDVYYIKQLVKQTARSVINDEFLGEFKNLFINVKDAINEFYGKSQILNWQEMSEICSGLNFQIASGNITPLTVNEKIDFLYRVGFLGVIIPEDVLKRNSDIHKYSFIFNEDTALQEVIGEKRYKNVEYLIHPIFCEYLHLDISKNGEFVLNFDWDYLYNNELYRDLKPTIS